MGQAEVVEDVVAGWEALHPDVDPQLLRSAQQLVWCGRLTEDLLAKAAQEVGFRRRGDYEVLAFLRRAEPDQPNPIEIADALLASASGMTSKLDRLEQQGLIVRERDTLDRRSVRISITEEGRTLADRAFALGMKLYRRMLSEFDDEALGHFARSLTLLLSSLDRLYRTRQPWAESEPPPNSSGVGS